MYSIMADEIFLPSLTQSLVQAILYLVTERIPDILARKTYSAFARFHHHCYYLVLVFDGEQ